MLFCDNINLLYYCVVGYMREGNFKKIVYGIVFKKLLDSCFVEGRCLYYFWFFKRRIFNVLEFFFLIIFEYFESINGFNYGYFFDLDSV